MRQILLHPGFHKTGTSSMQHFLWFNRAALAPYFSLLMLRHLKPVVKECTRFSRTQNPLDLVDLVSTLDQAFATHAVPDDRDLLISSEGLSGHLPGWPDVADYAAVPTLCTYLAGYLAERFPNAQVRILFTTRDPEGWLFSAYRHHLKSHRMTLDWPAYRAQYVAAADLGSVMQDVANALAPLPVAYLALEEAQQHPLGPGAALVDQMRVPEAVRTALRPVGLGNVGPDRALWDSFLTLNRSDLDDEEVAARKAKLAEIAGLGGWKSA